MFPRLLGALAIALTGCTLMISGSEMNGRVVDAETGAPVAGALVIAEWRGDVGGPVQSSQVCFHLEIATTDADGRYHIPAWRRRPVADYEGGWVGIRNIEVTRRTYKPGYTHLKYDPNHTSTILMDRFKGAAAERMQQLSGQGTAGCGKRDGSRTNELMLWSLICEEARLLPTANQPQARFRNMSFLGEIGGRQMEITQDLMRAGIALPPLETCDAR